MSTVRGKVIWLSSVSGGREMRGESLSGTTVIGTTLLRLALMYHLLRGALTGLNFSDLREDLEIVTGVSEVAMNFSDLEVVADLEVVSSLGVVADLEVLS